MPQLTWLGEQQAKRAARRVPYRLLEPVEQVWDPRAGKPVGARLREALRH